MVVIAAFVIVLKWCEIVFFGGRLRLGPLVPLASAATAIDARSSHNPIAHSHSIAPKQSFRPLKQTLTHSATPNQHRFPLPVSLRLSSNSTMSTQIDRSARLDDSKQQDARSGKDGQ
jgi:hypothetical protein